MTWTDDPYGPGHIAGNDLDYFIGNFQECKALFAGTTSPSNPVPGQFWGDLAREILRIRDNLNGTWNAVFSGDKEFKKWVYRNDTCDGWVIDSSITDCVLAVKGGSQAYNVSGGAMAGTWTGQGHALTEDEIPSHGHSQSTSAWHSHPLATVQGPFGGAVSILASKSDSSHTHTISSTGGDTAHNHGDTFRPAATVGTLQYPDLP